MEPAAEEQHVPRAVHRLQIAYGARSSTGDVEHVLAELLPVPGRDPKRLVVDERRLDLGVAAPGILDAAKILERVEDRHALRMPEGRPGRALVEVEEVELSSEPAMVARPRLLEPLEIGVEVGLGEERRPVDPRQLRVALVAAPVRAREACQLERLDRLRVLQVRPAAKIGEVALRVERDVALGAVDELDLVRLALRLEARACLLAARRLPRPRTALGELPPYLGLDRGQVVFADRLGELEVVVEAVLDRRADRDLHARDGAGGRPRRGGARAE